MRLDWHGDCTGMGQAVHINGGPMILARESYPHPGGTLHLFRIGRWFFSWLVTAPDSFTGCGKWSW